MTPLPTRTSDVDGSAAKREYSQLLRMHERLVVQLQRIRAELDAPGTKDLLREIRNRTGNSPAERLLEVSSSIEESLRALKLSEAAIQRELLDEEETATVEGVPNLPPHLARFLAERRESPGFSFEVLNDEVRGWVIQWKQYTGQGMIRGFGQFYERPYAWLDE